VIDDRDEITELAQFHGRMITRAIKRQA